MRETELRARLARHLGGAYETVWSGQYVLADLGGRTVDEAIAAGVPCKTVWRAVWAALELAPSER